MDLKKVLFNPSGEHSIKRQQVSQELSRIIGDHDFNPELKLSKYSKASPKTIIESKIKKTSKYAIHNTITTKTKNDY